MSRPSRTFRRAFAAAAAAVTAAVLLATPAAAATTAAAQGPDVLPPAPQSVVICNDGTIDDARVCITGSAVPPNRVLASINLPDERKFAGIMLVLLGCDDAGTCTPVVTKTAADVTLLTTGVVLMDPAVSYYEVNASWVDDKQQVHTGEVVALKASSAAPAAP